MTTTAIPRYYPCRVQNTRLEYGTSCAGIELLIDDAQKALVMFSTRKRAEKFIEDSVDLKGWTVAYMGYDEMAQWLRTAASASGAESIAIDIRASGLHPTFVIDVGDVLKILDECDTESGDPLSAEAATYSL